MQSLYTRAIRYISVYIYKRPYLTASEAIIITISLVMSNKHDKVPYVVTLRLLFREFVIATATNV